jgi:hypothetical protein
VDDLDLPSGLDDLAGRGVDAHAGRVTRQQMMQPS